MATIPMFQKRAAIRHARVPGDTARVACLCKTCGYEYVEKPVCRTPADDYFGAGIEFCLRCGSPFVASEYRVAPSE